MTNKIKKILSEISPGELLDKISILEIKLEKVKNREDLKDVNKEYEILKKTQDSSIESTEEIKALYKAIKGINVQLWKIEDDIRSCEKK